MSMIFNTLQNHSIYIFGNSTAAAIIAVKIKSSEIMLVLERRALKINFLSNFDRISFTRSILFFSFFLRTFNSHFFSVAIRIYSFKYF